jgi:hypothetical protein
MAQGIADEKILNQKNSEYFEFNSGKKQLMILISEDLGLVLSKV